MSILAYADYSKCFKVHTDASEQGLGAVLYQDQDDGMTRIIAYASRNLSKSEKRYHSSKLEFLAQRWSVCEDSMNTCMVENFSYTQITIH